MTQNTRKTVRKRFFWKKRKNKKNKNKNMRLTAVTREAADFVCAHKNALYV